MKKHLFSMVELLVVAAILGILFSLLQPSLASMIEMSNRVQCKDNLQHLLIGMGLYEEDNEVFTYADTERDAWVDRGNNLAHMTRGTLWDYVQRADSYLCPSDPTNHIRSYSMSGKINRHPRFNINQESFYDSATDSPSPSKTFIFIEERDPRWFNMGSYWVGWWTFWGDNVGAWHSHGINMGFMDGHAEYIKWEEPETGELFVTRGNYRQNKDMATILYYYAAGTIKP